MGFEKSVDDNSLVAQTADGRNFLKTSGQNVYRNKGFDHNGRCLYVPVGAGPSTADAKRYETPNNNE